MSLLFFPHVAFYRARLKARRWKDYLILSTSGEDEGRIEEFLRILASDGGEDCCLLKVGKGRRVSMIATENGKKVFKLYTPKKGPRGLLHAFFPSKALTEYCITLKLFSLGIPVPQPFAVLERRWFPGMGESILVLGYLEGCKRLSKVFPSLGRDERGPFLERLARFAKRLHSTCFCHSDLWAKNILVEANKGTFFVVDLDGGFFSCMLPPFRAPVNLAQLLFSLNGSSSLTGKEVKLFLRAYGASTRMEVRTIRAYHRKFGPWPWKGEVCWQDPC